MDSTMPDGAGPERDPDLLARHAVEESGERLRLLQGLYDQREMVTLYAGAGQDCFAVSRVLGFDTARGTFDLEFNTDDCRRTLFRETGRVTGVALPRRVKLQFALERFTIAGDGERARLRAPLPVALARLQRRDAFRVEPPPQATPRLWLHGAQGEFPVQVFDVSATGVAFAWPTDQPAPPIGTRLQRCRFELPGNAPIRCDLVVRGVEPIGVDSPAQVRVGSAFDALDSPAARAIQVFVNLAQVRGRRARPRLG
ncbi:MAG: flagellar brake protein [Burkholderiaceae bacterium]